MSGSAVITPMLPPRVTACEIIHISQPAHPIQVGAYASYGYATDIDIVGNVAYLGHLWGPYSIDIADITDPTHPTRLGFFGRPRERQTAIWQSLGGTPT